MDKSRKFDFDSDVRVPAMDEIMKVASDFSDPEATKTTVNLKEALSQNARVAPKLDSEMSSMRQKMRKLAREIAEEEGNESEPKAESPKPEVANSVQSESPEPVVTDKEEVVAKPEKPAPKKKPVPKVSDSGEKSASSDKKK